MARKRVTMTVVDRKGPMGCHRGHQIGDSFDFDRDRGQVCPMLMHVAFPYIDILRYGGEIPCGRDGDIRIACPDADVINIVRLDVSEDE